MGKFKISMKFDLNIEGDREDVQHLSAAVQDQLRGLVAPTSSLAGEDVEEKRPPIIDAQVPVQKKVVPRRRAIGASTATTGAAGPLEFRHAPERFGNPLQSWSVPDKCIWLLFVLMELDIATEVSSSQLVATFNAHFKAAKRLHPPNVPRDLAKAKIANPSMVGEDKGNWYLTDAGKARAAELVKETSASSK